MTTNTNPKALNLGQSMTLSNATDFHLEIENLISAGMPEKITISCVENEVIDVSILQLLTALVIKAKVSDSKIVWDNPSIALFAKSTELGLDTALGL